MKKDEIIVASVFAFIGIAFGIVSFIVQSAVAKWILGNLSIAVIIFVIVAIIEAIIKNNKKPKNSSDFLLEAIKKEAEKPDFKENLEKRLQESAIRRNKLFDGQRPDDEDYGYSCNNPVMTSSISTSNQYLESLRTIDGQKFTWHRVGSRCIAEMSGVEHVMVDEYQLFLNEEHYKTIFICPYGLSSSYTPKNLILSE